MTPSTATETGTGAGELTKKLMLTPRGETKRCPPNTDLCVFFNGKVCYDPISGTCCEDGSGFCSDGFVCGYDIAANYCCEPVSRSLLSRVPFCPSTPFRLAIIINSEI